MISKKTISEIVKNRKSRECVFWGFHEKRLNELQSEGVEIKKIFTGNKKLLKESEQYIDYKLLKGEAKKYFIIFPFWFKEKSTQDFYKHTLKEFGYLSNDWLTLEPTVNWNTGENKGFADIYGNKCSGIPGGGLNNFSGE